MNRIEPKSIKALAITLVILILMSIFSFFDNSVISNAVNSLTKGLFQVSASAAASADTASFEELKVENQKLKQENAELREQLADYYDVKSENSRLLKYYDIKKQNPSFTITPANVIMRDANDDFYSFSIDAGASNGISVNDPVITENGLVGRISRVDLSTCLVKTILSPDVKISAIDKKSGDIGIVSGSASLCDNNLTELAKIADDCKIKEGDMIVTSGEGGIYPKNLIIGKVKKLGFNSYDTSRYAVIEPYENIERITAVAVITDFGGEESER